MCCCCICMSWLVNRSSPCASLCRSRKPDPDDESVEEPDAKRPKVASDPTQPDASDPTQPDAPQSDPTEPNQSQPDATDLVQEVTQVSDAQSVMCTPQKDADEPDTLAPPDTHPGGDGALEKEDEHRAAAPAVMTYRLFLLCCLAAEQGPGPVCIRLQSAPARVMSCEARGFCVTEPLAWVFIIVLLQWFPTFSGTSLYPPLLYLPRPRRVVRSGSTRSHTAQ